MEETVDNDRGFDVRGLLETLRRNWWIVAVGAVLGLIVAVLVNQFSTPMYKSTARVYISFAGERAAGSDLRAATTISGRLADYAALASTPVVLGPAAETISAATGTEVTPGEVASAITITPRGRDTNFLNVTASTVDPLESAVLANGTAAVVVEAIEQVETPNNATESLVRATVAQPAVPARAPAEPKRSQNLLYGLLLGTALGVGAALLRSQLDRTVKSPDALERASGLPVLGLIPFDSVAKDSPVIPSGKSAARSEAFRKLRTNLQYVNVDNPPRVIAVVSGSPSEGKSTTATNLALTIALAGQSVLLVETDLRRPRLAEYLGIDGEVGLTDVLAGKISWQDAVVPWNRGLFSVLPQGEQAPNPTEILGSRHMQNLLQELRDNFDYVILDTSPVSLVSDSTVVASQADGVILVARYGATNRDMVTGTIAALDQVNAHTLGTVLTLVPANRTGGYGYGHGYGYGYGYGSKSSGYTNSGMVYAATAEEAAADVQEPQEPAAEPPAVEDYESTAESQESKTTEDSDKAAKAGAKESSKSAK